MQNQVKSRKWSKTDSKKHSSTELPDDEGMGLITTLRGEANKVTLSVRGFYCSILTTEPVCEVRTTEKGEEIWPFAGRSGITALRVRAIEWRPWSAEKPAPPSRVASGSSTDTHTHTNTRTQTNTAPLPSRHSAAQNTLTVYGHDNVSPFLIRVHSSCMYWNCKKAIISEPTA